MNEMRKTISEQRELIIEEVHITLSSQSADTSQKEDTKTEEAAFDAALSFLDSF